MTWWRRQRIPLIALLAAAIAVVGVHLWLDVLPAAETEARPVVGADRAIEVAGQQVTLDSARWDEFDAPDGSRTVSVRLHSSGGPDATFCGAFTLAEEHGSRVWLDAQADLDVPYDSGERSCLQESGPYDILSVFLVPEDAVGPFRLDVPGEDEIARFRVDP